MTCVRLAKSLSVLAAALLLYAVPASAADMTILQAAAKSKQTGLPMFVTFGGDNCPHCVAMKKSLQTDPELRQLITTQYVYLETSSSNSESKQFIEHYKLKIEGIPHTVIISAKGELVKEQKGNPDKALKQLLMEGIEKTGGMKTLASANPKKNKNKLEKEELEKVLADIATSKGKLDSEETKLDGMVELLAINRAHGKVAEVKKETGPIFATINKDKAQATLLTQARQLDAAAAAVEAKKPKLAETTYKSLIKKHPDSAAAKYAEAKLEALSTEAPPADAASAEKPSDKPAS